MPDTRYSREDYADAVAQVTKLADAIGGATRCMPDAPVVAEVVACVAIHEMANRVRVWAAMFSEAANRAPTHAELVAAIKDPRCPEHDIICRWGCEMECSLADCSEDEVQAAVRMGEEGRP